MKTIEQIAQEKSNEIGLNAVLIDPIGFAMDVNAAWLEQQEPAAIYAGVEGDNGYEVITTFVDIPDLAPLFLAPPPAKSELDSEYTRGRNDGYEAAMLFVRQQSQEPVAWYDKHGMITHDVFEGVTPLFLAPPPSKSKLDSEYTRGRNDGYEAAMLFVKQQSQEPVAWRSATGYEQPAYLYYGSEPLYCKSDPLFLATPPAIPEGARKVFICTSCEGVYSDEPVTKCDCMPAVQEFDEGYIVMLKAAQGEQK